MTIELQTPPTEIEIAEAIHGLPGPLSGVVRRLAFQRDQLLIRIAELEKEIERISAGDISILSFLKLYYVYRNATSNDECAEILRLYCTDGKTFWERYK